MNLSNLFSEAADKVLASFEPKDHLNKELWNGFTLKPIVRKKLLAIAKEYYKSLNLKKDVVIKDIVFTGSNANFNWSSTKYSDIDLHLKIEYDDIDENSDLVTEYMFDKKALWNKTHNIKIYGYDVELFAQDASQDAPFDAGVYSLTQGEWLQQPKEGIFKFNSKEVLDKTKQLEQEANRLFKTKDVSKVDDIDRLKERIQKLRKDTVTNGGEFDPSNLAYKYLRRKKILDKLTDLKTRILDRELTLSK